jgi:4-amino-4-deoxy-L-arabinose transferase-like glycosyltransferase
VFENYFSKIRKDQSYSLGLIYFAAIVVLCQMAWVPGFFQDGHLYAGFAKNAAQFGHWLIPRLSEDTYSRFHQHPPFIFALGGIFFKIFGSSVTAARLFGVLFSLLSVFFITREAKKQNGDSLAFYAGLILIATLPFIKKSRFPNLDTPLMLFILLSILSYYRAFVSGKSIGWILSGIFFGFALLCKGPPAFAIPLAILLHLGLTKNLKKLIKPLPWISLVLGMMIFSIWPLMLKLTGNFDVFEKFITNMSFNTRGRGESDNNIFEYLIFLFKYAAPWLLLSLYGIFLSYKRKDHFILLMGSLFLSILIPFSFMTFKLSHYLVPLYPAMAVLAAYPITSWVSGRQVYIYGCLKVLIVIGALVLLIFPLTTKTRRDKEIFKVFEVVEKLENQPNSWGIIDSSYDFFRLANLLGFHNYNNAYKIQRNGLEAFLKGEKMESFVHHHQPIDLSGRKWIFLINPERAKHFSINFPDIYKEKLVPLIYIKKYNLLVLIERRLINRGEKALFTIK